MTQSSIRRLAAVLIADVAGYSRLMEQDEAGTHARLNQIRAEVTDPAVHRHDGRIVRSVGDGVLVEFASATSALQAAIEIQRAMAARNRELPPRQRIDHRIGINLGDILVEEHDIAGTGVNVAARLETLAPPGGIAISGTVREQVREEPGVRFVDAGEQQVKNIARPVRVFRVELDGVPTPRLRTAGSRGWRWAAAAGALAAALVAGLWLASAPPQPEAAPQSLVVLPFDFPAQSPGAAELAESLTRQVTSALTQLTGVTVITPAVAAKYAGQRGEMQRLGRELGVRYALDGRVEAAADRIRVAVHVVDTGSGSSLWSGEMQAPSAGGTVPLSLVGQLSDSLRAAMRGAELKRVAAGREAGSAYAKALAAIDELEKSTDTAQLPAIRAHFEHALTLDPRHVPALTGYAHTLVYLADQAGHGEDSAAMLRRADEISLRAVTLQPDSAEAWAARANVLYFRGQFDAAAEAVQRGLRLNPYLVMLHAFAGQIHLAQDRGAQALAAFERGIELNPTGPMHGALMHHRSRALLVLGRHAEAIETCERGMAFGPEWPDYMLLAAAYALQGNEKRAARARTELLRLKPEFTIGWHAAISGAGAGTPSQYEKVLHEGLRKAGIPE